MANVRYHGHDGFGDVPDPNAPDESHFQTEHAVNALLKLSNQYAGNIGLQLYILSSSLTVSIVSTST